MEEKIYKGKKNGLLILFITVLFYGIAIAGVIFCGTKLDEGKLIGAEKILIGAGMALSLGYVCLGWLFWLGLKVIRPQEALVLTLFGKYVGTIKEAGFYYVNPFCSAVNPAAKTKLSQSGDVKNNMTLQTNHAGVSAEDLSKKISLKLMTLSNSKQKINDCLGNPIEIAIAVTWRVVDTAKAVFNVDNYKEYLSLQCDSALRDIVRIYPYDVAQNVDTTGDGVADEGSLRGSSEVVANRIKDEIQKRVNEAGIVVEEARITYLAMLQRLLQLCFSVSRHQQLLMLVR